MTVVGGNIFLVACLAEAGMDRVTGFYHGFGSKPLAVEVGADIMIKGSNGDGIYNKDPLEQDEEVK